jgi:hypothetical protein
LRRARLQGIAVWGTLALATWGEAMHPDTIVPLAGLLMVLSGFSTMAVVITSLGAPYADP